MGVSAAYEIDHHEWAPMLHTHYFRGLSPHSRWALGGGVEFIFGDEKHVEIGLGAKYTPIDRLEISIMPGIVFTHGVDFSLHGEITYEVFHLCNFHFGPMVGYAWTNHHSHCSAGVHVAYGF